MTFEVGDRVQVICSDGATFEGRLDDITDNYVLIDGRGYADVAAMVHA